MGARAIRGVTLIELMVALVLGLIVAGAAMAVFITNRQTYIATESLGRLQEGARVAFELMSRDLREASTIPCSNETVLNNVVAGTDWWAAKGAGTTANEQWEATSFLGYTSGSSDAIQLIAAVSPGVEPLVISAVTDGTADVPMNTTTGLASGDLLLACDYGYDGTGGVGSDARGPSGTIFQGTTVASNAIAHATSGTPGNSVANALLAGTEPQLQANGIVSVLRPARWFIADNGNGGESLFRSRLLNTAGALTVANDEIVRNADDLDLMYLEDGGAAYVVAGSVTDWSKVKAVRIQLHLTGTDRVDGAPIERTLEHVVTVRNRAL
jgi:type IV pilus assembly protein PilW